MNALKQKALSLPLKPGVYIMMDAFGRVIYVGKAKQLKNRVSQYFQEHAGHSAKTLAMVSQIHDFDFIVADSEFEALVLECSLIKRHLPHYNILLKDGKGYPFIRLGGEPYARFSLAGKWRDDGARYFGPYGGRVSTQNIIESLCAALKLPVCERKFPRDIGRERPCLQHHMNRCMAPCRGDISEAQYNEVLTQAVGLLEGKYLKVADALRADMEQAAEELLFEKAAQLRDRLNGIVRLGQKQKVVSGSMADTDVVGLSSGEGKTCVAVLHFMDGGLVDRDVAVIEDELSGHPADTLSAFLTQYYPPRRAFPREILLPLPIDDAEDLGRLLTEQADHKVVFFAPQRGDKKKLVQMAENNASEESLRLTTREEKIRKTLLALQKLLGLAAPPRRIEAYDISNTGASDIVGAMTVFVDTNPLKRDYRHYKIKGQDAPDDYAAMREMLTRRFERLLSDDPKFNAPPDLILMDGGLGHVQTALTALSALGLSYPVYGMVKDDRHRTRGLIAPDGGEVGLSAQPALFALIGRMQEETHRFAITFHQEQRGKHTAASALDAVPGVGPARRGQLLTHFKSLPAIKRATLEELMAVVPKNTAQAVYTHFHPPETEASHP